MEDLAEELGAVARGIHERVQRVARGYAQVFVGIDEVLIDTTQDGRHGGGHGAHMSVDAGVGVMIQDDDRWRFRSGQAGLESDLGWTVVGAGEVPIGDSSPAVSSWGRPHLGDVSDDSEISRVQFDRDQRRRWFAVADSDGVCSVSASVVGRTQLRLVTNGESWSVRDTLSADASTLWRNLERRRSAHMGLSSYIFDPGTSVASDVLLVGATAAGFMHEVVGHPSEAGRSHDLLTAVSAGAAVTVVDDPRVDGFGHCAVDDEGVETSPAELMSAGAASEGLLSRRWTGKTSGVQRGRRASYRYPALPRQTTLVVHPGLAEDAELMRVEKVGLLVVDDLGSARVDRRTGAFSFHVPHAIYRSRGHPDLSVHDAVIVGDVRASLASISGVGTSGVESDWTTCTKGGQAMPVGLRSPSVRLTDMHWIP